MNKRRFYFRMITASLLRRRSRMVIALLAIAIGATILSGLVTIYYDVPRQLGNQFRNYGANMLIIATDGLMTEDDVSELTGRIKDDELVGAAPYEYNTIRINNIPIMAAATDMDQAKKTSPFWRVDGSWPENEKNLMIGKNVAATFNVKVGDTLTCTFTPESDEEDDTDSEDEFVFDNYIDFTVCGILDTGGNEEEYVYMSIPDMAALTSKEAGFDVIELSVSAESDELDGYVREIGEEYENVKARLVKRVTESETKVLSKLKSLVLLVTIVVLVLTMICVGTTMTAVVAERRKEIGLRKSLGAHNSSIIAEFMGEGMLLGAFGGLIGSLLGFIFAETVSVNVFNSSITFVPWLIPLTIVASVLVTAIACLIPIRSATQIEPALVLKGE